MNYKKLFLIMAIFLVLPFVSSCVSDDECTVDGCNDYFCSSQDLMCNYYDWYCDVGVTDECQYSSSPQLQQTCDAHYLCNADTQTCDYVTCFTDDDCPADYWEFNEVGHCRYEGNWNYSVHDNWNDFWCVDGGTAGSYCDMSVTDTTIYECGEATDKYSYETRPMCLEMGNPQCFDYPRIGISTFYPINGNTYPESFNIINYSIYFSPTSPAYFFGYNATCTYSLNGVIRETKFVELPVEGFDVGTEYFQNPFEDIDYIYGNNTIHLWCNLTLNDSLLSIFYNTDQNEYGSALYSTFFYNGDSPYITNGSDLQLISEDLEGDYILTGDIDFGGGTFTPIGNSTNPFIGTFDGQGYTISNVVISGTSNVGGLFGYVANSYNTIENVHLVNVTVNGTNNVGGLIGLLNNSRVENCSIEGGIVNGTGSYVGGLVGYSINSTINNSYSTANVYATDDGGGLVGESITTTIINSYSTGNIYVANEYAGGLVSYGYQGSIDNSYATGNVVGVDYVGGLCGECAGGIIINNTYALGNVTADYGSGGLIGSLSDITTILTNSYSIGFVIGDSEGRGLVGAVSNTPTCTSSYWDTETSNHSTSACGTGKTTVQMVQEATFTGWDFVNIWQINESISYPYLFYQTEGYEPSLPSAPQEYNVTAGYSYLSTSASGQVIAETTDALSGTTDWFPLIVIFVGLIVIISMVILIIWAVRGSGLTGTA